MAISLYDACVPNYLQVLGAIEGVLSKGAAHCKEKNIDPNEIVETRLAPDMLPFRFQIVAVAHHSAGAIKGVKAGAFGTPAPSTADYAGLQKLVSEAREAGKAKPDESEFWGRGCHLLGGRSQAALHRGRLRAVLLAAQASISTPPPPTTSCAGGVPLGKRDFLGR
jgi:hypothetical protein